MSHARRTNDRRRRVLYSTQQADLTTSTAASRRAAEQLREARRPTAAYAARVHRRLRGRWFSLVPVKRRTLVCVAGMLWGIAILLCGAHYASVAWPAIVNQPEIARPLRLDRPDSFGRWVTCVMLAACAGASLLIYQVRRYRVDDYTGQYRLWRLVLIVMFVASINSLVSVVDWAGAMLDVAFGKRVALSGNDWLGIVISIGGAVLAIRLVAEVRRSRWALLTMIAAWLIMAIAPAAKWHFFAVESIGRWSIVTSAPLLACTTLFISLGGYLRMLFREVRNLDENDSLAERFEELKVRFYARRGEAEVTGSREKDAAPSEQEAPKRKPKPKPRREVASDQGDADDEAHEAAAEAETGKRRWWSLRRGKKASDSVAEDDDQADDGDDASQEESNSAESETGKRRWWSRRRTKTTLESAVEEDQRDDQDNDLSHESDGDDESQPRQKRRWFGLRAAKAELPESNDEGDAAEEDPDETQTPKKRGRFSMGFGRRAKADAGPEEPADGNRAEGDEDGEDVVAQNDPPAKKRGLGGWLSRGAKATSEADERCEDDADDRSVQAGGNQDDSDADSQEWVDPDDIDWDSLNKTERRKLRKQLKRQDRAA
ncbi:hypothetical protein Pla52o_07090 [Novipirellula galeiformis]|uniref:Uncharacterized protein n=1 Tax=Novipirellula galeiformis TaxID=2528004 RepID=A0A5C6CTC4_9BACT|nr:hypothetical protein [Novipirellula galeiformis]TWU26854.1 hypothetical protein Pla52o_07090 [Novipirellula galeiformis]